LRDEPTRRRLARRSLPPLESQVIDAFIDAHLVISDYADDEPVVLLVVTGEPAATDGVRVNP